MIVQQSYEYYLSILLRVISSFVSYDSTTLLLLYCQLYVVLAESIVIQQCVRGSDCTVFGNDY